MKHVKERDLGEQPLAQIMREHGLKPHDLVCHATEQISHKMVARALKGRRLTMHVQFKILNALNKATDKEYGRGDLFNYR
jgi:acyl transferase domain-containing protein